MARCPRWAGGGIDSLAWLRPSHSSRSWCSSSSGLARIAFRSAWPRGRRSPRRAGPASPPPGSGSGCRGLGRAGPRPRISVLPSRRRSRRCSGGARRGRSARRGVTCRSSLNPSSGSWGMPGLPSCTGGKSMCSAVVSSPSRAPALEELVPTDRGRWCQARGSQMLSAQTGGFVAPGRLEGLLDQIHDDRRCGRACAGSASALFPRPAWLVRLRRNDRDGCGRSLARLRRRVPGCGVAGVKRRAARRVLVGHRLEAMPSSR